MVIALIQVDFIGADCRGQQRFGICIDKAASDIDPAFGTFENDALFVLFVVGT